jgi:hypothetical protein
MKKVTITGDVNRPGQHQNIRGLYRRLFPVLYDVGVLSQVRHGSPLSHDEWMRGYETGEFPEIAGIVIGFELPPCAKRRFSRWIDVRRHPIRFTGEYYSITSNAEGVAEVVARSAVEVGRPTVDESLRDNSGVLCLQVPSDASLILGTRFAQWSDIRDRVLEWARDLDYVSIAPHPLARVTTWLEEALLDIPHSGESRFDTYTMLARCRKMATACSSTGVEAPYFGCEPTFLLYEPVYSPPVLLNDHALWRGIFSCL